MLDNETAGSFPADGFDIQGVFISELNTSWHNNITVGAASPQLLRFVAKATGTAHCASARKPPELALAKLSMNSTVPLYLK